jgi:cysteine desulfurase
MPVYLDCNATTPIEPEVGEVVRSYLFEEFGNEGSRTHEYGARAKQAVQKARDQVAAVVGVGRDEVLFTSGATEANRTAMLGLAEEGSRIAVSPRDHPSVQSAAAELAVRGHAVRTLPLESVGTIARGALADEIEAADEHGLLVTVTPICGQTGLRDRTPDVAESVRIHADATQAAAWDALDFAGSPWTSMTLAPHKFGGPRGIGALVVRSRVLVTPLLPGSQELGLRGGTEAVSLAVGFARALELAAGERQELSRRVQSLRERFEAGIIDAAREAGREAVVIGRDAPRAPHISAVALPGIDRQAFVMAADLEGVCLATGTACASGSSEPSPILFAMRLDDDVIQSTFRASLGRTTTDDDMAKALEKLRRVLGRLPSP